MTREWVTITALLVSLWLKSDLKYKIMLSSIPALNSTYYTLEFNETRVTVVSLLCTFSLRQRNKSLTTTVCMSAGLCLRLIPTLGHWLKCVKCYKPNVCILCVCVCERETERTRRSQLRRLVLLSHRQPVQASSGWKVAGIRWNLRHRQLAGHTGKGYRGRCLRCPFKKARDNLLQRNGTMGLHQPVVRRGRARLQGGRCVFTRSRYYHLQLTTSSFLFYLLVPH